MSKFEKRDWRKFMASLDKNKTLWEQMEEDINNFFSACENFIDQQKEREERCQKAKSPTSQVKNSTK